MSSQFSVLNQALGSQVTTANRAVRTAQKPVSVSSMRAVDLINLTTARGQQSLSDLRMSNLSSLQSSNLLPAQNYASQLLDIVTQMQQLTQLATNTSQTLAQRQTLQESYNKLAAQATTMITSVVSPTGTTLLTGLIDNPTRVGTTNANLALLNVVAVHTTPVLVSTLNTAVIAALGAAATPNVTSFLNRVSAGVIAASADAIGNRTEYLRQILSGSPLFNINLGLSSSIIATMTPAEVLTQAVAVVAAATPITAQYGSSTSNTVKLTLPDLRLDSLYLSGLNITDSTGTAATAGLTVIQSAINVISGSLTSMAAQTNQIQSISSNLNDDSGEQALIVADLTKADISAASEALAQAKSNSTMINALMGFIASLAQAEVRSAANIASAA